MRHPNQIWLSADGHGGGQSRRANGVLLNDRLVLTCAHIFNDQPDAACPDPDAISVEVAGEPAGPERHRGSAKIVPAGWFPRSKTEDVSDLAILELERPWTSSDLVIGDAAPPHGVLAGSAWDHSLPGFADFSTIRSIDQGFATESGVLRMRVSSGPECQPGYSGFPIFDRHGAFVAIHQKASDTDFRLLVTASARMIRTALRQYLDKGGPHPVHLAPPVERPDIDSEGRVLRRREHQRILDSLLAPRSKENLVTAITSLSGDGGFGKSTLAQMIFEDHEIRDRFAPNLGWITIGRRKPQDMVDEYAGLAFSLDQDTKLFGGPEQVARQLGDFLATRHRGLIVVDDVWDAVHLQPFLKAGADVRILVTTRNRRIAEDAGTAIEVDEMAQPDATRLISKGLTAASGEDLVALAELAKKLHSCAQWIEQANGLLQSWTRTGKPLTRAIAELEEGYREEGFEFLEGHDWHAVEAEANDPVQRRRFIGATQQVALREFNADAVEAYKALAVLPEDVQVPRDVITAYWGQGPSMLPRRTRGVLDGFIDLCLIERPPPGSDRIGLHDTKRDWLLSEIAPDRLKDLHARFAATLATLRDSDDPAVSRYAWRHEIAHLRAAGLDAEANACLGNFDWISRKLDAVGIEGVRQDHEAPSARPERRDPATRKVGQVLIWDADLLKRAPDALASLLTGRLSGHKDHTGLYKKAQITLNEHGIAPVRYALRPPGAGRLVLSGHNGWVNGAVFSPDGSQVLTASSDRTARLWRASDGAAGPVLSGHNGAVTSAVFSPDGSQVLTASRDGTARLWRASDGAAGPELSGHNFGVNSAVFSPDGSQVLTASYDDTARLWRASDGAAGPELSGHNGIVRSAVFSPDGAQVLTASEDGTARLWRASDGAAGPELSGHNDAVTSAVFSPDGSQVLTASNDGTARLWRASDGAAGPELSGHNGWVNSAVFSPDGSQVLTASSDRTARLWRASDGAAGPELSGHNGWVNGAVFSPDGSQVLTASSDRTARLWRASDGAAGPELSGHNGWVNGAVFSPDGSQVLTASRDGTARLWRASDGVAGPELSGHNRAVNSAVFSPDGSQVLTASDDRTARLWRASDGAAGPELSGHNGWVNGAVFSPDGSQVLTASRDGTARLWRASDGAAGPELSGHNFVVTSAVFSPDGSQVLTASHDGTALLWRASDGAAGPELSGHNGIVLSAVFSPDGSQVLTASRDRTARLWRASDGAAGPELSGHNGTVLSAVFSPDGAQVLTAAADGTARLWRASDGAAGPELSGHDGWVYSAVFNPDGSQVLTASHDGTARLWRASDGAAGPELSGHDSVVNSAVFSPDGSQVLTASDDGTARLWRASNGAQVTALACDASVSVVVATHTHLGIADQGGAVHLFEIDWQIITG